MAVAQANHHSFGSGIESRWSVIKFGLIAVAATAAAYIVLTAVFRLNCWIGGHNMMEAIYGGFAAIVLSIAIGAEYAWFRRG